MKAKTIEKFNNATSALLDEQFNFEDGAIVAVLEKGNLTHSIKGKFSAIAYMLAVMGFADDGFFQALKFAVKTIEKEQGKQINQNQKS